MEKHIVSRSPPCLARRTQLVGFVLVTSLLIVMSSSAVLNNNYQNNIESEQTVFVPSRSRRVARQASEGGICTTPTCVQAAEHIIRSLDIKVNPCDNFYKFACGGWIEKHSIPDDKTEVSQFSEVVDTLNKQIKALLEKPSKRSDPKVVQLVKDMYSSCINLDKIENAGSEPLKKVLNTLGGWPVVMGEKWDESKFDWMQSTFALRKLGYNYNILLAMGISVDLKNNKKHVIMMDQANLGMPDRSYLLRGLNDNATKAYYNLMVNSAKKLGANQQTAEKELLQALNFEITLANYSLPSEERRDFEKLYNKKTISQLQEIAPQIDFLKYLNGLLNDPVDDSEIVILSAPSYLKKFGELITETDKRIVANYMMWRVVFGSMSKLSKEWKELDHEYVSAISGQTVEKPRWEQCVSTVSNNLDIPLSSYYIRHHFKGDSKKKATEMEEYIRKEMVKILRNVDWMANDTRKLAIEKAEAITPFIGYPKELENDTLLTEIFKNLTLTKDDYFENYYNISRWGINYSFSKLREPNLKGDWKSHAEVAVVNAFYNPVENSIDIPAGILQKAFFNKDRPNYMNYGGIGFMIGHEITHGFDDTGKQFDKEGNSRVWWDKTTNENFNKRAQCIISQYGNYTTEIGIKLNGRNTQGENIADNGGLKEAYRAYHSWVRHHGPEGRLPGLTYTPNQLFFITAANIWCGKYRPELLKLVIASDNHSPSEFRTIGPMSNFKEFSDEFGCPLGSKMNPRKKCQVW